MLHTFDGKDYYTSLPQKRLGTCALIYHKRALLIIQPTYHRHWILPGGIVEAEESPLESLQRELQETLSIDVFSPQLLAVDYVSHRDVAGEYIQMLFGCKELTDSQVSEMQASAYDIKDFCFTDITKALEMLTPNVSKRLQSALNAQAHKSGAIYLENGRVLYDSFSVLMAER